MDFTNFSSQASETISAATEANSSNYPGFNHGLHAGLFVARVEEPVERSTVSRLGFSFGCTVESDTGSTRYVPLLIACTPVNITAAHEVKYIKQGLDVGTTSVSTAPSVTSR